MTDGKKKQKIIENPISEQNKQNKKKLYYSFLTIVLLFCLIQVGFGVILNISKTISYRAKISTMEKIKTAAMNYNDDLKQEIKMFSSMSSLEGIARNNLKMAGEDEVLVLINNNPQVEKNVNKSKLTVFFENMTGKKDAE